MQYIVNLWQWKMCFLRSRRIPQRSSSSNWVSLRCRPAVLIPALQFSPPPTPTPPTTWLKSVQGTLRSYFVDLKNSLFMQVMFPLSQKTASFEPLGFNLEKTIFFFFKSRNALPFNFPRTQQWPKNNLWGSSRCAFSQLHKIAAGNHPEI